MWCYIPVTSSFSSSSIFFSKWHGEFHIFVFHKSFSSYNSILLVFIFCAFLARKKKFTKIFSGCLLLGLKSKPPLRPTSHVINQEEHGISHCESKLVTKLMVWKGMCSKWERDNLKEEKYRNSSSTFKPLSACELLFLGCCKCRLGHQPENCANFLF